MVVLRWIISIFMSLSTAFLSILPFTPPGYIDMPDVQTGEYGQWVDPFIGTGGIPWVCAMLSPAACTPFGMVRLGADTTFPGGSYFFRLGTSGYYYGHNYLWGFSHTRLSGTGAADMGHFRITPATGNTDPTQRLENPIYYTHKQEKASVGYYAVNLTTLDCLAELTATTHTGVHRYTFRTDKDAHIFIDATSFLAGGKAYGGSVTVLPDSMEIEGFGTVGSDFAGRYGGLKGYFVARFDTPFENYSTWSDSETVEGRAQVSADDAGADLCFGNIENKPIELKIGISFVSLENARENLDAETDGLKFDDVRAAACQTWNEWLSRIKIKAADDETKTIFYTALYHSMIMPTDFTDVDGQYLGFKGQISTADDFTYRTDMSLWDTFRTEHPLLCLIAPEVQLDCLKSLVKMADIGGTIPRWPSGGGYTGSMFGSPADMVIAESYLKEITDFDVEKAYGYMKNTATNPAPKKADGRDYILDYIKYGYCPADFTKKSVSYTLEYAWADNSISLLADALGKTEDAAYFKNQSQNYKNVFDSQTKYFRGRNSDGSWVEAFSPIVTPYYDAVLPVKYADPYCEGSARQWRWSVPYDAQSLIELFGSKEYFIDELDDFMSDASNNRAAINPGSGYWQGNQHDIHAPYLFIDAGRPDLTQKWVRWSLTQRHSTDIDGLDGNDDGGTTSAWYVFSSMGLYPVAGTDRYWLSSPIVDSAEIDMGDGKTLRVIADNQSSKNIYVESVTLNGEKLDSMSITHAQIANGGTLHFTMSATPSTN